MSNPFLNYGSGGGDLAALQDGTVDINIASIKDQSLIPGLPVASDASKKLITRLLGVADLVPGTIPAVPTTTLTSAGGTETLVNDGTGPALAVKGLTAGAGITLTSTATAVTIDAPISTLTSAGGTETLVNDGTGPALATKGLTAGASILLTSSATAVTVAYDDARLIQVESDTQNIVLASTGLTSVAGTISTSPYITSPSPLVATGTFTAQSATLLPEVAGARFTIVAQQTIVAVGVPIVHWPAGNAAVTRKFNIWTDAGVLVAGYNLPKANIVGQYYTLGVSLVLPAGIYRFAIDRGINTQDTQVSLIPGLTFDPRVSAVNGVTSTAGYNVFPSTVGGLNQIFTGMVFFENLFPGVIETPILRGPGVSPVLMGSDLDFSNVYSLLRCLKINGIQPNGGVYSETATATTAFAGITAATNILGRGLFTGSTSVPAGAFVAGDCYGLKIGGTITCSNNDAFTLIVRTNFGLASPAIFQTYAVIVDGAQVGGWWEMEVEFTIRAIGGPGVANIMSNGNITYTNASSVYKGLGVNTLTSTLFDTTVQNMLAVTYQTASATITSFAPSLIVLTKLY